MLRNKNIIITAIVALGMGLGIGYFLFNQTGGQVDHSAHEQAVESSAPEGNAEEWICSMHPQIRQKEPGLCPICEMDLIPAGSNQSDDPLVLKMTEEAVRLSDIQTTTVGNQSTSEKTLQLNGKIQLDERRAVSQVAHIPGRIEQLFVTFTGEPVRTGQKLATIFSPELITAQRELLEALKLQDVNASLTNAARNKLRYWKIPDKTIREIETSGNLKETFTLYAENSGIVTNRHIAVGDHVSEGQVLFDLTNLSRVWVLFDAYEEDLASIRQGDQVTFTTPSLPGKTFNTRITFIDPVLNPRTRAVALRAEVANSRGLLKPEMFVRGTIRSAAGSTTQLTIPRSAVLWTGVRSVIYVKLPNTEIPSFQFREVVLGELAGDHYAIEEGLENGEEVVTNGSFVIDAAAQLNNQQSMMNREVQLKKEAVGIPDFQADAPATFKEQLSALVKNYIELKDAFVETDPVAATEAASQFLPVLEQVDMTLLKGDAHLYWMEQSDAIRQHGEKITEMEEVEAQRKQFGFLSEALINAVTAFGTDGSELYVQFCPMAFNNEGADWLALEESIRNPYFGDKMMNCGTVKTNLSETAEETIE